MNHYTIFQWLMLFYFYCFFGWCFESTYVSLKERRFVNRGFMRGPFLPIYGSGAIMMLVVSIPVRDNLVLTYIAGMIGATALEYVTGVAMEALFKVRYWDYSDQKFQFQGHICLSSSLAWGALTILMTRVIHHPVERALFYIPDSVLHILVLLLTVFIAADFALSFKAAMDLRDILIHMEKAKEELALMQRRLDVIIAVAEDEMNQRKEKIADTVAEKKDEILEHVAERKDEIVERVVDKKEELVGRVTERTEELVGHVENVLDRLRQIPAEYLENVKEEVAELSERYKLVSESRKRIAVIRDKYKRHILKNNPITSVKFKDALEELKDRLERKDSK